MRPFRLFTSLLAAGAITVAASANDPQVEALIASVEGQSVGLLTNPTGVDLSLVPIADILFDDPRVDLVSFFAPEHGLRGDQQAGATVVDYTDPETGLPVYAVYRTRQAPTPEQLEPLDALIFDIQDVGVRFYTYVWTMTLAMEACAAAGVDFVVYDRPNPIGADRCEGGPNVNDYGLVGRKWPGAPFGVATRHGMTAGEIAQLVNGEWMDPPVNLTVIPVPGYMRGQRFEEDLGRVFVRPSPNMPTIDTAHVYIATAAFESANVSEGRGTTQPFENIGAPYIDGVAWAEALNALGLPGVHFRQSAFIPVFDDYTGQVCNGVFLHILDRETYDPFRTSLHMLQTLQQMYPGDFELNSSVDWHIGETGLVTKLQTMTVDDIIAGWQQRLAEFHALRANYLIYPEETGTGMAVR